MRAKLRGFEIQIDEEDAHFLTEYNWTPLDGNKGESKSTWYFVTRIQKKTKYLHRMIMGEPEGMIVDHASRDTLDLRRCNLRVGTRSQNQANKLGWSKSGLKGARKYGNRFYSSIKVDGKLIYLGSFMTSMDAHNAYVEASKKYHGVFSNTGMMER